MFRAAKDTSWALRLTPGLQVPGPLFVRGGSFAFSISERYLKVPASTGSADEPTARLEDTHILTRAQGRAAFGGSARRHGGPGFSGLQLQAKSQG